MTTYRLASRPSLSCDWCGEYLSTANVSELPTVVPAGTLGCAVDETVCDVCAAQAALALAEMPL